MTTPEPGAATPLEQAFARYCAEESMVEDITAPHGEAFAAGFHACSAAVIDAAGAAHRREVEDGPSLRELRYMLNELHYVGDGGGVIEEDLAVKVEQMMRWLVEQYLRRGTHTTNDPAVTE